MSICDWEEEWDEEKDAYDELTEGDIDEWDVDDFDDDVDEEDC